MVGCNNDDWLSLVKTQARQWIRHFRYSRSLRFTCRYSRSRSRSFSPSLNNQNDLENYELMDIRMCCHLQIFVKRRTPQTVWGVRLKFSCLQKGCVIVSRNKCKAKALPSYELHILELEGSNIFSLSWTHKRDIMLHYTTIKLEKVTLFCNDKV